MCTKYEPNDFGLAADIVGFLLEHLVLAESMPVNYQLKISSGADNELDFVTIDRLYLT